MNKKGFTIIEIILSLVVLILIGGIIYIWFNSPTDQNPPLTPAPTSSTTIAPDPTTYSEDELQAVIPSDALLREYQQIPHVKPTTYLLLYVEDGYSTVEYDYATCPGNFLGKSIDGKYHLALFQSGVIIDEVMIPIAYELPDQENFLELSYQKPVPDKYSYDELLNIPAADIEVITVQLLNLQDYTGDGVGHEILFHTSAGGCGFFQGIVIGYDETENSIHVYSDWIQNFEPDRNGDFYYLFDCGNHGNILRREDTYRFDSNLQRFVRSSHRESPCE